MAYVFDIDGTLVDSNDAHAKSWQLAISEAGFDVQLSGVRKLIGMGGDKLLPKLTGLSAKASPGREISERRGEIFRKKFLPHLKAFPKVRKLLSFLKENEIEFTIATSASREDLQELLKQAGITKYFKTKTSSDDAKNSKPDPDIVVAALKKLKTSRKRTLMVGDTPYDILAAQKAGIETIAFRCGGVWNDHDLKNASVICDGPSELLLRLKESWSFSR